MSNLWVKRKKQLSLVVRILPGRIRLLLANQQLNCEGLLKQRTKQWAMTNRKDAKTREKNRRNKSFSYKIICECSPLQKFSCEALDNSSLIMTVVRSHSFRLSFSLDLMRKFKPQLHNQNCLHLLKFHAYHFIWW